MKGFFKFLGIFISAMATVLGMLAIFDKFYNKNRIKGDYLECDLENEEQEDIEE